MKYKLVISLVLLSLTLAACSGAFARQATVSPTANAVAGATETVPATALATAAASATAAAPASTAVSTGSTAAASGTATLAPNTTSCVACDANQPVEIKGSFQYSNDIITTYYVENAVALNDMYGFVKRDKTWLMPIASQFLGFLKIDPEKKTGTFDIDLPARPTGMQVSVNPNGKNDAGVQIFALSYSPNLTGGPYSEGDDPNRGWPSYLASVKTDSENKDEVTGGKLLIWAPDDKEVFSSDFGADGLLFTQDDPMMKVPQGYSVIDLDQKPFKVIRDAQAEMTLYEPKDAAIKDFSQLSYKDAFDQMFQIARKEYAFNGIDGKQPDWDKLYAELAPRIEQAQTNKDAQAYYLALRDFTLAFKDGHIGLSGGETGQKVLAQKFAGGYGFAVRQLNDGRVMVVYVLSGGPADKAGMKTGAILTQFGGKPIQQAIEAVDPPTAPNSMVSTLRYEQARYLVRAPVDTKTKVTFTNPQGAAQSAELTAIQERQSIMVTSPYRDTDPNGLPVEYTVASNGIGYVRISSNYDDLNLVVRLFQRALEKFKENNIESIIIDLRANSGGAPLGLAGFLYDKEITLGQLQYYSEKTGTFEAEGPAEKVYPNAEQYRFNKMFLLVDQACASACELEAYGFSQIPGMVVIGEYPTSGTEAEVSRGQFKLPEGMSLQLPTGRFVLPDGSIFLEGKGVQPTERIPVNETTVLSQQDPLISKALELSQK